MYSPLRKENFFQLILLISFLGWYTVVSQGDPSTICPPEDLISPCICTKNCLLCPAQVKCSNILHHDELQGVFEKSEDWTFWNFYIENSVFMYIPSDFIVEKRIRYLYLRNNIMTSLFDKPPPPTNVLVELELTNLTLRTGVKWEVFSSLHKLKELNLTNFVIPKIDQTFLHFFPQGLTGLYLTSSKTKQLTNDSFSKLTKLTRLFVKNTEIKEIQRSMFPPHSQLLAMSFSGNQISTLPDDIFTNMPDLKSIYFSRTNIVTLKESVFGQIFPNISVLHMEGNAIDCNCQMKWLTKQTKFPMYLEVTCTKPNAVQGLSISELRPSHFAHCE
ncbi:uncharacterized protein TNCV_3383681 [Trichonephila clavipes]|uniref:Uncharacterized protein n=1 Tax=Trichonephila clavipes TaxID=2585209 RepID=A0A8X6SU99_TRICX|nr:uncharacterized protein TNCV_3383681 [Trichonephila clavipes]